MEIFFRATDDGGKLLAVEQPVGMLNGDFYEVCFVTCPKQLFGEQQQRYENEESAPPPLREGQKTAENGYVKRVIEVFC